MTRWLARAAFAVAGVLLAIVAIELIGLQRDLGDARGTVADLSLTSIEEAGGLDRSIAPAEAAIDRARSRTTGVVFDVLRATPVIGEQFDAVHDVVADLDHLVGVAGAEVDRIEATLDAGGGGPAGRVALADDALGAIDRLLDELEQRSRIGRDGLVWPARRAIDDYEAQLADAEEDLTDLRAEMSTARDLLVGPTSILVLAANNAELRAGMGMHLSAGIVTVRDGAFETSPFIPAGDLTDITEGRADVPAELEDLYRRVWDFGHEWRTTSTTPNFPAVGDVLTQLAARTPIGEVDAVLSLDVPALAPLLEATGPVEIEGLQIDAGNVSDLLLRDIYLELGEQDQASFRRQFQSHVARQIFDAITERDIDIITLAEGLVGAAEGRNLLGWSPDPDIQALWESLGADGSLSPESFLVAFQNATSSKRDYYLEPSVAVSPLSTGDDGSRRVRIVAALPNPVVEPSAPYIDSLNPFVPVGVHRAYVTFHLPDGASDIEVRNGDLSVIGTDGPTEVAAVWLRVPEGETRAAVIDVSFPPGVDAVELVPSARVQPQSYRFGPVFVNDRVPRVVRLPRVDALRSQDPDYLTAGALTVLFAALVLVVSRSRHLAGPEPDVEAARTDGQLARALALFALALLVVATVG